MAAPDSFAKGLVDVGISSGVTGAVNDSSPNSAVEPVNEGFLGMGQISMSQDPVPGTPPPDWFGSNSGQWGDVKPKGSTWQ